MVLTTCDENPTTYRLAEDWTGWVAIQLRVDLVPRPQQRYYRSLVDVQWVPFRWYGLIVHPDRRRVIDLRAGRDVHTDDTGAMFRELLDGESPV